MPAAWPAAARRGWPTACPMHKSILRYWYPRQVQHAFFALPGFRHPRVLDPFTIFCALFLITCLQRPLDPAPPPLIMKVEVVARAWAHALRSLGVGASGGFGCTGASRSSDRRCLRMG